jgi:hypothetical protein
MGEVRPDAGKAPRFGAAARPTRGFDACRARDTRFAVAQDSGMGNPALATSRNPVNVGSTRHGRPPPSSPSRISDLDGFGRAIASRSSAAGFTVQIVRIARNIPVVLKQLARPKNHFRFC